MQEIVKRPMVDMVAEATGKAIGIKEDKFVYLDTKKEVEATKLSEAVVLQDEYYQKDILASQLKEKKQYLEDTDHKFLQGYKPKEGEDLVAIEAKRDEAREFIRNNA
jgi:hypothetical protein